MARARNIKPGFYKNEELAECSIWARFIYPGLWQLADRQGRLEDRPKRIKGELLPFDSQDVDKLLDELTDRKFILRYEVEGTKVIQILKFPKHQNPHHREPQSTLPQPPKSLLQSLGLVETANGFEPGAADLFQGHQAQGRPKSSRADTGNRIPESPITDSLSRNPESPIGSGSAEASAASSKVWDAYAEAYQQRYHEQPIRNGTVNSQIKLFLKRVPVESAPAIAAFYVGHNKAYYVEKGHPVGAMLGDAEWLCTQWKRQMQVTGTEARQVEKTSARGAQAERLIKRASG